MASNVSPWIVSVRPPIPPVALLVSLASFFDFTSWRSRGKPLHYRTQHPNRTRCSGTRLVEDVAFFAVFGDIEALEFAFLIDS